ncbi:MAG: hypothetical protein FJX57_12790 [Alphaproteobacteria bacterium]|nr:hypothetical protein [Alphaproteobacteria bacterium]
MDDDLSQRPATLAAVCRRARAGLQPFEFALAEFLDRCYLETDPVRRRAMIEERPEPAETIERDAVLGAIGEHLHRRWRLPGDPPAWTDEPHRFLRLPLFPDGANATKAWLIADSPMAFRRRMIFTEAEPLRRARMPQDERWWTYETLRSGLRPEMMRTV